VDRDATILAAFVAESRDNLDLFDTDLLGLEAGYDVAERTARLFRTLHTIKGTCGFLDLPRLEALAHAGETVLGELRALRLHPVPAVVSALLGVGDRIRVVLDEVESGEADQPIGTEDRACLDALQRAVSEHPDAGRPLPQGDGHGPVWDRRRRAPDSSLRVDIALLDRLMNLVGELVLVRNQLRTQTADDPSATPSARLQSATGQLDRVTAELQDAVTRTRLQPIGTLSAHLPRLVHDVSAGLGRAVTLVVEGEETLVDKAVLDAMRDPLTQLVRNAVDHGIEPPAARLATGKPGRGLVTLRAFSEGGQVVIEVADDGAGIDLAGVRERAVELGLLTAEDAAGLGERESCELLFHPGLSTRAEATSVSGRGVGADIVRANVERVGGSVDVFTRAGAGTTFRIRIPITLAIVGALLVVAAGTTYAVPQSHVVEVVRVTDGGDRSVVPTPSGAPVLRLRGRLLPLIDVAGLIGAGANIRTEPYAVVVTVDGQRVGLLVDTVRDTTEIVVKPLGTTLGRLPAYAGATVLGDGSAALILDVAGLATHSGVRELRADDTAGAFAVETGSEQHAGTVSYLMVRAHDGGAMAVPLDRVVRLHELGAGDVEPHGVLDVVRCDGDILPLADLAELLPERRARHRAEQPPRSDEGGVPIVVCRIENGRLGLVVGAIDDIVHEPAPPARPATRDGVAATMLVGGRVTELLDVDRLAELALPGQAVPPAQPAQPAPQGRIRAGAAR